MINIINGEALTELRNLESNSIDSVVTDPPYGLAFMSNKWDYSLPKQEIWQECLRVLKPGGYLLAFSSPRTYHRLAVSIEDAGFVIRDQIMFLRGDQFPKSKTSLKTAHEPICMARKPCNGSEAANVAKYGTGALQIDCCRIGDRTGSPQYMGNKRRVNCYGEIHVSRDKVYDKGRWPTNVIHDGCLEGQDYSPFFYGCKASPKERGTNNHPTLKSLELMSYLIKLVTPPNGIVLDPFAGSGTTAVACEQLGFSCIGIERESDYVDIANQRLRAS